MKNKLILKSGILFLVIVLLIGSIVVIGFANNYGSRKGNMGNLQGNQQQLQESNGIHEDNCGEECDGECDGTQIKVSGKELKAMKISDVANLWDINVNGLLNEIVSTFKLKNSYSVDNTIDDIRGENRFSPFQIKDIADKLKTS